MNDVALNETCGSLSDCLKRILTTLVAPFGRLPHFCRLRPPTLGRARRLRIPRTSLLPESRCPACGTTFPYRPNRRFCSANCRKSDSKRAARARVPANARSSPTVRREQEELFDLATRMAKRFNDPDFREERLGYLNELVELARSGDSPKLSKILTMPKLLRPERRSRHGPTISQAVDFFCRKVWGAGSVQVIRGDVPEPPSGEIDPEGPGPGP